VGGWRRLYNEELHNLYALPNIRVIRSRRMRLAGHVARTGDRRNAYILVGKGEGKGPLGLSGYYLLKKDSAPWNYLVS
jgi:hypothetical protein